jgi:hypothetical protein
MKTNTMRTNPAFKQTQPLPLLTADFAQRAGRAAKAIARALPLAGAWPAAAMRTAGGAGKPNFNVPVAGLMGS